MRTPAGKECRFFYGNYFRGRQREECRLLQDQSPPLPWKPALCATCPVPDILLANACPHLMLRPQIIRPFPFTRQQVRVDALCTKSGRAGFDPYIGCGDCHSLPHEFWNTRLHDEDAP